MKKITAFFMALFPFLVVGLLFATGLISKNFTDKTVTAIEVKQDLYEIQNSSGEEMTSDALANQVTVFPATANDPTVYWTSQDTSIATVEKETGKLTCKKNAYGDVKLDVVAKTNAQAKAHTTVKVWDNKIHEIQVTNEAQAQFMAPGSQLALQVKTIPSERIEDPSLTFSIEGEVAKDVVDVSPTGVVTVGSTANGTYTVVIKSNATSVTKKVVVTVGSSIESIGFKEEGTTVIQGTTYNLYDQILTYPYDDAAHGKLSPAYFTFTSSNESLATIDKNGVITFTDKYTPGTPVRFAAAFAGLTSISAVKTVISSLNYYNKVNFERYSYTEKFASFTNPQEITDITYHAYPQKGNGSVEVISSDPSIVKVENGKLYALQPGKVTLTVQADATATSKVSDKVDVTIINSTTPSILSSKEVSTGESYYYPLRKNLSPLFENRSVTWSGTSDKAVLDDNKQIVYFKDAGEINITVKDNDSGLTDSFKLKCGSTPVTTIDIATGDATIVAGQKVTFKNGANVVTPKTSVEELVDCGSNNYVAIAGSKTEKSVTFSDDTVINLTITEPLVGITTSDKTDWNNYTTNAATFNLATKLIAYPSTATYVDSYGYVYTPEITYSIKADDDSAVDFVNNVLAFSKPTSVAITASAEETTKSFRVTSYCGQNGKFSLNDGTTNKVIQSGVTIEKAPGDTFSFYIDASNLYLKDTAIEQAALEAFNVASLSANRITSMEQPKLQDNKIIFTFKALTTGNDVIKISNGSFTFIVNLKVSKAISEVNLYCLGNKLEQNTTIKAYDKTNLFVNLDIYPLVAKTETVTATLGGNPLTISGNRISLSTLTGTQDLIITASGKQYKYTIEDCSSQTPTFKIRDTYSLEQKEIAVGGKYTLPANAQYATLILDIGGICSQEYFKNNFSVALASGTVGTIQGKYAFIQLPSPSEQLGYKDTLSVTPKSGTKQDYNLIRDYVGRIELPKHDNLDETDAKGLQRVHVYGNKTQYAGKEVSDIYSLPINVYDWQGNLIGKDDIEAKNKAVATLSGTFNGKDIQTLYNKTTGCFDLTFDPTNLFNWQEIFNNKFEDSIKKQKFSIYTAHGEGHKLEELEGCYAFYYFVVVNGINVYDQKGIETAAKTTEKSIVLQTNFGLTEDPTKPIKDDTPFTLTDFNFNEVYGNGYSINFHAATEAAGTADKSISCKHGFNTNFVGCWYNQFTGMNHRAITFSNPGECAEDNPDTFAYCTFSSFFQPLTIWCKANAKAYAHIKNCFFYNDQQYCRNAISISDAGNTTTIENCAFFNAAKISIMSNKGAVVQLKGDIDVYNFHGSDMFDCMGWEAWMKEAAWNVVHAALESVGVIQGLDYGSVKPVCNSYLMTTLGGTVKFYDRTEDGKDIYIDAEHGSEKAANNLIHATGLWGMLEIWSTVKPPLPLQAIHAPAYGDEFINGEQLNFNTRAALIQKLSRW